MSHGARVHERGGVSSSNGGVSTARLRGRSFLDWTDRKGREYSPTWGL